MLLLLTLIASDASAWEVRLDASGQEMSWRQSTIPYSINPAGDHMLSSAAINTLVAAATRGWAEPLGKNLVFTQGENTDIRKPDHVDQVNTIYFDDEWAQDPSLLALTYVWSTPQGEIIGFDLAINSTDHTWAIDGRMDANDLLNTLSHEMGHALGIDHSPDVALATMYPSSPAGEVQKRDLHDDDVSAALYLYGETPAEPTAGCSTGASFQPTWVWALVLPLLVSRRTTRSNP